jgi:hypothetical protein
MQIVWETLSRKYLTQKGLVEWLKVEALSSSPSTAKKTKQNQKTTKHEKLGSINVLLLFLCCTFIFVDQFIHFETCMGLSLRNEMAQLSAFLSVHALNNRCSDLSLIAFQRDHLWDHLSDWSRCIAVIYLWTEELAANFVTYAIIKVYHSNWNLNCAIGRLVLPVSWTIVLRFVYTAQSMSACICHLLSGKLQLLSYSYDYY